MPTQHDFRAAATALRTLATTAGSSAVAVSDVHADVGLDGGTATAIIDAAMNACFLNANAVKIASNTAAEEFDRRAERCAEYTRSMQQWRTDLERWHGEWSSWMSALSVDPYAIGPAAQPSQPLRWPDWVEEG